MKTVQSTNQQHIFMWNKKKSSVCICCYCAYAGIRQLQLILLKLALLLGVEVHTGVTYNGLVEPQTSGTGMSLVSIQSLTSLQDFISLLHSSKSVMKLEKKPLVLFQAGGLCCIPSLTLLLPISLTFSSQQEEEDLCLMVRFVSKDKGVNAACIFHNIYIFKSSHSNVVT